MSKYIITADWHIRDDKPRCRKDTDWYETQRKKIKWVVDLSNSEKCSIIVAGDILHRGTNSQLLENMLLEELRRAEYDIFAIPGNHDLPYHSMKQMHKSTFKVLLNAGVLMFIPTNKVDNVHFFGFDENIPRDIHADILVLHTLVLPNGAAMPFIEAPTAQELLSRYPNAKTIITGDNHTPFIAKDKERMLINPGSLIRQTADQIEHEPRVYIYENGNVSAAYLPVEKGVVVNEYILTEKQRDDRINTFVETMKSRTEGFGLSFEDNMETAMQREKLPREVVRIIQEAMEVV